MTSSLTPVDVARKWVSRRSPAEWAGLAAGIAAFGYLGWDGALWDPGFQLLLHLLALGAIIALVWLARRGAPMPRTRVDVPVLALLAAYALATLSAANAGLSMRATAGVLATTAMLPVALICLRTRTAWVAFGIAIPVLGLAAISLAGMLERRIAWYAVGAPGLVPPLRLAAEGTPLGSVAVPPFVLLALVPIALLVAGRPRRWLLGALGILGLPLTVLSGSRSAWLAIAVAAIAFVAVVVWRRDRLLLPSRWTPGRVALAAVVASALAIGIALALPRLSAVTSLIYRGNLWRDTLAAWSADPILGLGPGIMPFARQAAAEPLSFPVRQPHSHNIPLGILGDAGILGLAAGLALLVTFAWVAGPWRSRSVVGRTAASVLIGMLAGGLFEDLTFVPGFNLLLVVLAAIALVDAGAVSWRPFVIPETRAPRRPARVAAAATSATLLAAATLLVAAMVIGDAAAIAYRSGVRAAAAGEWESSAVWLTRSVVLDPWHPTGPKALAVAAASAGRPDLARAAAERAVTLNPGDGPSWTNLAVLCEASGDRTCAIEAAEEAIARAAFYGGELVNAAIVLDALGESSRADDAYRLSLLTNPMTALATSWPREIEIGDVEVPELDAQARELNQLLAGASQDDQIAPDAMDDPAVRALAHAFAGNRTAAEESLAAAIAQQPASVLTWDVAAVLRRHWGMPLEGTLAIGEVVRGARLPEPNAMQSRLGQVLDIATFRGYPGDGLVRRAEHLVAGVPFPWSLARLIP